METRSRQPSHAKEQRKSPRYRAILDVDLLEGQTPQRLRSMNVSRHGIFLATEHPPHERFLVQLRIYLPDGPLAATAFVSRAVRAHDRQPPGVGLQFFALAAHSKHRWDEYIHTLSGTKDSYLPSGFAEGPPVAPDEATFLIKLRSEDRLQEFYDHNVLQGGLYMATPVIKETGAKITLVVIHPKTEEEQKLRGEVIRVCRSAPKGMEIRLDPLSEDDQAHFRDFVATGVAARGKVRTADLVPTSIEPSAPSAPAEPAPAPVDAPRKKTLLDTLPPALDAATPPEETVSIDIVVDEQALEESEQFEWREVTDDILVIDFDLKDSEEGAIGDLAREPPQRSVTLRPVAPPPTVLPRDPSATAQQRVVKERHPRMNVAVRCEDCAAEHGTFKVGAVHGVLGVLATRRPYWCAHERTLVSVVRLNSKADRQEALDLLGEEALHRPVSLRFAFQLADLMSAPRCPTCERHVRVNRLVQSLSVALASLDGAARVRISGAACPACGAPALVAEHEEEAP